MFSCAKLGFYLHRTDCQQLLALEHFLWVLLMLFSGAPGSDGLQKDRCLLEVLRIQEFSVLRLQSFAHVCASQP